MGTRPVMEFVGDLLVLGSRAGLFSLDLEGVAVTTRDRDAELQLTAVRPLDRRASLLGLYRRGGRLPPVRRISAADHGEVCGLAAIGTRGCVVGSKDGTLEWVSAERLRGEEAVVPADGLSWIKV